MKEKNETSIKEIDCLEAIDNLYSYLDGELNDATTLSEFKNHLEHCHSCYTRSELEKELNERIRQSGKGEAPESLQNRLRNLIDNF